MFELYNINKVYNEGYKNEYHALKDISIKLPDSGLVLISGKSGSGKTTLLNILAGLDKATSGIIKHNYDGCYKSFVFQTSELINDFTVKENIELAISISNNKEDVYLYIDRFDLNEYMNHKVNELSAGQKQRLSIIVAICLNRAVLMCDEPTGALDVENSKIIAQELATIAKEKLVIVITHEPELFKEYSVKEIIISDGKIISDIDKENKTIPKISSNKSKMTIKNIFKISMKSVKNSLLKYIMTILSFFITLSLLMLSIMTFMTDDVKARYYVYSKNDLHYVDICQDYNERYIGFSKNEFNDIKKTNDSAIQFINDSISDFLYCDRTYFTSECLYNMKYGKSIVNDDEIIISDVMAKKIIENNNNYSSIDQLIDKKDYDICNYKIVGIYDTNSDLTKSVDEIMNSQIRTYQFSSFVTYNTYLNFLKNVSKNTYVYIKDSNRQQNVCVVVNPNLKQNEILTPSWLKDMTIGDNKLKLYSQNYLQKYIVTGYVPEEIDFIDVNVLGSTTNGNIEVSSSLFDELALNYSFYNVKTGISFTSYDYNYIKYLNDNFIFDTQIEGLYLSVKKDTQMVGYIELVLAIVLAILTFILLMMYLNGNITKSKKNIGVLACMGLDKKQISYILIPDILSNLSISFCLSIIGSYLLLRLQNWFISMQYKAMFTYTYYQFIPCIVSFSLLVLFGLIMIVISIKKINKKPIIDIIYEK